MILVGLNEMVEVAGNGGHREVRSGNPQVLKLGNASRKNGRLDLPRCLQFSFDGEQTAFVRKHYLQGYIPQRKQQGGEAQRVNQRQDREVQHTH